MKFIHIADVHLGAKPDAGSAYSDGREREIWNQFARMIQVCNEEEADLFIIAGDLFHRQPLLRELKEVNYLFSRLENTKVVLIAGNHDYLKKDSYYRSFPWVDHVKMLTGEDLGCVEFPELELAVYGLSYHTREILEGKYDEAFAGKRQRYEILVAHGGDEKHIPIQKNKLVSLGYDYVALGHIHKPGILIENRAAYAGALEPIDKNDTGAHGYIMGMLTEKGCRIRFVEAARRSYVQMPVAVDPNMTGHAVKMQIKKQIEERGVENIYKVSLEGFRDPEILFDMGDMDCYGNLAELQDLTKPAYDFEKLQMRNQENLLGRFIESFQEYGEEGIEYQALCEGVQAIMETRRG